MKKERKQYCYRTVNTFFTDEDIKRLKIACAIEGVTQTKKITDLTHAWLDEVEAKRKE